MALNPPHRSSAAGTHAHVDPYPDEYLVHNYPLMAVGGSAPLLRLLRSDPAAPPELSGPVATAPAPVPAEAPPPPAAAALADAPPDHRQLPAAAATAAVQLPQQPAQAVLHGPDAGPPLATHRSAPSLPAHGARVSFYQTLLHLLTVRAARMTDLPKESPMIFKVVVLDQLFQLPPRKPRNPQPGQVHLHSRLSPKNPQSLLYPDGLMLPQWVTRHREQIPSVYVGFYELAEHVPQSPQPASPVVRGPLDSGRDGPAAVGAAERQWDQALVAEINDHKRQLIDRQIKFAAVLVLSPAQEADPLVTEERVAYVRRTAGLEAKNSFFLLAQSNTDLLEFVTKWTGKPSRTEEPAGPQTGVCAEKLAERQNSFCAGQPRVPEIVAAA
ncbi:MAG: hypothetical protein BJ554DRAFT_5622 [Olpidium bornovanus]|uniref:Uncharacterized protein n=1 Tax=Olpidium bornovanus TaxID=278681 RepID=A0A8H7ZZA1_9FUNG|nr:MAG: hypothetical protein BJ554DRAFT_5622 [Olpidium bornovanus]